MPSNQDLFGLLAKLKPAKEATKYIGDRSASNIEFVNQVARTNVLNTIDDPRKSSEILASMEKDGKIKMLELMHHLNTGKVRFIS